MITDKPAPTTEQRRQLTPALATVYFEQRTTAPVKIVYCGFDVSVHAYYSEACHELRMKGFNFSRVVGGFEVWSTVPELDYSY